jgi:DNA-binding transcriptional ArsR family regulator
MDEIKILDTYYKIELNGKKISKTNVHVIAYIADIWAYSSYKGFTTLFENHATNNLQISKATLMRAIKLFEKNGLIEVIYEDYNCFNTSKCIIYRIKLTEEFIEKYGIESSMQKTVRYMKKLGLIIDKH